MVTLRVTSELNSPPFIGVDWGTSRFRLFIVDAQGAATLVQDSGDGIGVLAQDELALFLGRALKSLPNLPVLMSGMVGSSLGLAEVPYLNCPVPLTTLAKHCHAIELSGLAGRALTIVPGVRWQAQASVDVMRGEEVQVFGVLASIAAENSESKICLPGTHSKWVDVTEGNITRVNTALTGELYGLLTAHSVLVNGEQIYDQQEFLAGVKVGSEQPGLLGKLFSTRARVVTGGSRAAFAASYLSGLLIGSELSDVVESLENSELQIVAGGELGERYQTAADYLGVSNRIWDGDEMTVKGLQEIWRLHAG